MFSSGTSGLPGDMFSCQFPQAFLSLVDSPFQSYVVFSPLKLWERRLQTPWALIGRFSMAVGMNHSVVAGTCCKSN